MFGRDFVWNARLGNLAFGTDDALCEGWLGQEECTRNFCSRESAERAERKADLRFGVECRVATGKDKAQAIVGKVHVFRSCVAGGGVFRWHGFGGFVEKLLLVIAASAIAAGVINELALRHGVNPRCRVVR